MSSSHSMNSYENDSSSGGSGIRTINRLIKMKKIRKIEYKNKNRLRMKAVLTLVFVSIVYCISLQK